MGQGRRWLAAIVLVLSSLVVVAGELPGAPSADRALPDDVNELRVAAPTGFDFAEYVVKPVVREAAPEPKNRVFDKKFALLAGLGTALTVADFEMTQHCLQRRTCVESNPLMPTSHAGMYLTNIPLNAVLTWWAYHRKEHAQRLWWVPPLAVVASHAVGVGTNVRFIGR